MKKFLPLFILLNIALTNPTLASHLKGGEITWECTGNGEYVFQLKIYRDCNGINLTTSSQFLSTSGGCPITYIPLNFIASADLTPPGCGNSCNNPNNFGGATQEFIFKSNPITINGTPPATATGWTFYWDIECCRNTVDNVIGGATGSAQMVVRSHMFASSSLSPANPCFDNSPRFVEPPTSTICVGYPFSYNPVTVDNDYDSLSYAFDYPFSSNGSGNPYGPMQFVSPYSVNNPMPGNPTINAITGEMTLFPFGAVQGNYATCIRVDSYRCGVKIASVFREIQINLSVGGCNGACDGTGNNQNDPPVISPAPFQNSVTGLYTDYADTVLVGDTVSFTLNVLEMETLVIDCTTPQLFFINLKGTQVDSVFGSPYTECDIPPCAHLDIITPAGPFTYNKTVHFNWAIDCAHATNECSEYTSYFFAINANDDACPTPALNTKTIEVVVRGLHIVSNGDTLSVNTPYTNIQWYLNGVLIPGATDDTLITTNSGGIYTVQTLSPSGCSLISNEINIVHVGISDNVSSINNLTLYPNPVSSLLHVELKSKVVESAQLKIMDGLGRELKQELIQLSNRNNSFDISTNDLQNGIYYLSIKGKENICSKRIIVMH